MSGVYILIVAWTVAAAGNSTYNQSYAVTMQEFSSAKDCQFASIEVAKIAPKVQMVCVPKGTT